MLVLAGPGSGKTRVVAHRCAFLLKIARIRPDRILVVCFNRGAMHELRQRIRNLVGDTARRVAVHTYHSLALALTERSMTARAVAAGDDEIDFDEVIDEANRWLRGQDEVVGVEPHELRDRLLGGFEYVLVDEYQDIDARQYELVTHVASPPRPGRRRAGDHPGGRRRRPDNLRVARGERGVPTALRGGVRGRNGATWPRITARLRTLLARPTR